MSQSSSVIFSLRELERMEEERVRSQAQAAAFEGEARERALREAHELVRLETETRERQEAEARRDVEQRAREEAARIEAIRLAGVEAARAAAEAQARADERERERRHELEVERSRAMGQGRGLRGTAGAAAFGVVVAAGVAMAIHFGLVAPRARAGAAEASAELASRDVAIQDLRAQAAATETRMHGLEGDVAAARGDGDKLRADLETARRACVPAAAPHPLASGPSAPHPATQRLDGFTSCPAGSRDPLCVH
jgi:colicin import membrane protein